MNNRRKKSLRSLRELRLARQSFLMIYILIEKEMERRLSDVLRAFSSERVEESG